MGRGMYQPSTQEKAGDRVCGSPSQTPRPACGLQCRHFTSPQNCGTARQGLSQPSPLTLATCRRAVCERGARVPARPRIVGGGSYRGREGSLTGPGETGREGVVFGYAPLPLAFLPSCDGCVRNTVLWTVALTHSRETKKKRAQTRHPHNDQTKIRVKHRRAQNLSLAERWLCQQRRCAVNHRSKSKKVTALSAHKLSSRRPSQHTCVCVPAPHRISRTARTRAPPHSPLQPANDCGSVQRGARPRCIGSCSRRPHRALPPAPPSRPRLRPRGRGGFSATPASGAWWGRGPRPHPPRRRHLPR